MTTVTENPTSSTVSEAAKPFFGLLDHKEVYVPRLPDIIEIYEKHERSHWLVSDIDMRVDVEQWRTGKITPGNKEFIKMILRNFTQSDKDVEDAYVDRLLRIYKHPDVRMMLLSFANRESTHVRGYKHLNDTLGFNSEEFMSEFLQYEVMRDKHLFLTEKEKLDTPADRALYLAKQCLAEGVMLFGSFSMLLMFAKEGKIPGGVSVNEWSIAEEGLHATGLARLFRMEVEEHPEIVNNFFKAKIYELARKFVAMEDDYIDLAYSVGENTAATAQEIKNYVRYICDYRMVQLGLKPQFGIKENPLPFLDLILGNTLTNFFEATVMQYSKGNSSGEYEYSSVLASNWVAECNRIGLSIPEKFTQVDQTEYILAEPLPEAA